MVRFRDPTSTASLLREQGLRGKALIGHFVPGWSPGDDFISWWYDQEALDMKRIDSAFIILRILEKLIRSEYNHFTGVSLEILFE